MESLLSNLKAPSHNLKASIQLKRKENTQRCKNARRLTVQDKRKIPNNLELSNGKFHSCLLY